MKTIKSFTINHNTLAPGIYISRIDDDITTYDIRFKKPNAFDFLSPESAHTIEHLFATYARNSEIADSIIYVGPMGCQTGFYLLVRNAKHDKVISLVQESIKFIIDFSGEIPGSKKVECGNYLLHDLEDAKEHCKKYYEHIKKYTVEMLEYAK